MKVLFSVCTIIINLLIIIKLKLLDNFYLIVSIITVTLVISLTAKFLTKNNVILQKITSGILIGSAISITTLVLFTLWFTNNFPK